MCRRCQDVHQPRRLPAPVCRSRPHVGCTNTQYNHTTCPRSEEDVSEANIKHRSTGDTRDEHHIPVGVHRRHPLVLLHDVRVWHPQWKQVVINDGASPPVEPETIRDVARLLRQFVILAHLGLSGEFISPRHC